MIAANPPYQPPLDDLPPEDAASARREAGVRGRVLLIVSAIVVVTTFSVVWSAYQQGVRTGGREGAPVIRAAENRFKIAPPDPGGSASTRDQASVFERLEAQAEAGLTLTAPARQPLGLNAPDSQEAVDDQDSTPAAPVEDPALSSDAPEAPAGETTEPLEVAPSPQPQAPPAEPSSAPPADPFAGMMPYAVQLGSFRSERGAEFAWEVLLKDASDLFEGRAHAIAQADLGDAGLYYRVYVLGFTSAPEASEFCDQVIRRGHGCLATRR